MLTIVRVNQARDSSVKDDTNVTSGVAPYQIHCMENLLNLKK